MKKRNWMLLIGGSIIGLICIVILFPGLFTNINPYGSSYFKTAVLSGKKYMVSGAPFPPSHDFILGSDELGRDIYSMIIYGTRLTMLLGLLVVLGRFLLALPLGILSGFGNGIAKTIINQFGIAFSAIPALVISVIVLRMRFFTGLFKNESILAFVIVLSIVGFAKLGQVISERVEGILSREFIKGETAIGKSRFRIAVDNVIPHLSAELSVLFFMEFASVLSIIMQLGIFDVFVGNLRIVDESSASGLSLMHVSFEPEWASMLGTTITNIIVAPWTVIPPVVAFFISIFGLNLVGEGLRNLLQKRDSLLIPRVRRALSLEASDFKLSSFNPLKGKFRAVAIIILAFLVYTGVNSVTGMKYKFDSKRITGIKNYNEVIVGTRESDDAAGLIAEEMKKDGFTPISKDGFVLPYDIKNEYYCYSGTAKLTGGKSDLKLKLNADFVPESFGNYDLSGQVYDTTGLDMFSFNEYKKFNNKIILLNGNLYSESALDYFVNRIMKEGGAKGILLLEKKGDELPGIIGSNASKYPILWISEETEKMIFSMKDCNFISSIKCRRLNNKGRNILGILPGKDKMLKDKAIMLGLSYNFTNQNQREGIDRLKFEFEMLKKLSSEKRDRPVIVAFWDGTLNDECSGEAYYSSNAAYEPENVEVYLDLTRLNSYLSGPLYFSSELSPITRNFAWAFAHSLKTNLTREVKLQDYKNIRPVQDILNGAPNIDELMYINGRVPIIYLGTSDNKKGKGTSLDDIGSVIFKTIQRIKY